MKTESVITENKTRVTHKRERKWDSLVCEEERQRSRGRSGEKTVIVRQAEKKSSFQQSAQTGARQQGSSHKRQVHTALLVEPAEVKGGERPDTDLRYILGFRLKNSHHHHHLHLQ